MANGDVGTESHRLPRIAMEHGTVLNIAARSDADLLEIAARNSCGPEAAACCHQHIANHDGGFSYPGVSIDLGIGPGLGASHGHGSEATSLPGDLSDNLIWCRNGMPKRARVASSAVEHPAFNRLVLSSNLRRPIPAL